MRLAIFASAFVCLRALAQTNDPNLANPTQVVTVKRDGYTIAALVTHLEGARGFRYGVALFPGHPGIMRLREEDGQIKFTLGGNFLVRSRRQWLDEETLVAVIDAPSDEWASFSQRFRETPRYGADVAALLTELGRRFAIQDWTLVGTSEGSISAFHAGRMNPALARRVILTASVIRAGRNGPGLCCVDYRELRPAAMPSRMAASLSGAVTFGLWLASMSTTVQPSLLARSRNWRKTSPGREILQ